MNRVFALNQVTTISFRKSEKRDDLYTWKEVIKKRFFRKPISYYHWTDGYGDLFGNHFLTDEELLSYFKTLGRTDMYIKDKVLYQKPYIMIYLSNGRQITQTYEDNKLCEYYYHDLLDELSHNNIIYKDYE